jgi:hypothetical protein
MQVTVVSLLSGKRHTKEINITEEHLKRWRMGELLQDVCPHLTPDEREFLISGATKEEWDKAFPPE